jgi:hypothetical protein
VTRNGASFSTVMLMTVIPRLYRGDALRCARTAQLPARSAADRFVGGLLLVLWVVVSLIISLAFLVFTWFAWPRSRPGTVFAPLTR